MPLLRSIFAFLIASAAFLITGAFPAPLPAQQLALLGLRSQNGLGQFNGLKADAAGNLYTLLDAQDGVRLLKLDPTASQVLAETDLGQSGDQALALALDPAGNVYITGTSLSNGSLSGTAGTSFPARAGTTTNSFLAKFSPTLTEQWLTFLGSGKMAVAALDASATQIVVTGGIFSPTLPATANGIQQAPLPGSSGNGFVESFDPGTGTLQYATYLSGANGDTQPSAIALDPSGNAFIAGTTTATGFPTVNALVPVLLNDAANPVSGFLTKLTPAGDGLVFSTFVPGNGLSSIAVDAATSTLTLSGDIARGFFPVTQAAGPIATNTAYQSVARMALDGSAVSSAVLLAPATNSYISPGPNGSTSAVLTTANRANLPPPGTGALQSVGNAVLVTLAPDGTIQRSARLGGLPVQNSGFASLPTQMTGVVSLSDGSAFASGGIAPTLSSALLPTQTYDLTTVAAPNAALPSTVRDALPPVSCFGSACAGGAGLLVHLANSSSPQLALSVDDLPNLVLRNTGATEATGLQIDASGYIVHTACTGTLPAAAECDIALIGSGPGSITVSSGNAATATAALQVSSRQPNVVSVSPKELDFGFVSAASAPRTRTLTLVNLASTPQTIRSQLRGIANPAYTLQESSSDCIPAGDNISKVLPANSTCHIALQLAASSIPANDGVVNAQWTVGSRDIAITGYTQAAAISVSAVHIGFGRQFNGGLHAPRFLLLSNGSDLPQAHAALSLPPNSPFSLSDGCPSTLAPQSICRIDLAYRSKTLPSADAATLTLDGGISVLVDGETLPQPSVSGASVNPNLAVSPLAVRFANPVVATTVSTEAQSVTIQNTGTVDFSLSVTATGDFAASSCPSTLPGGGTCTVTLTFTPSGAGTRQGLLAVAAGSSAPVYVTLTGQGAGFLPTSNGSIDFGEVPVQTPSVQWFKIGTAFTSFRAQSSDPAFSLILVEDQRYGHGAPDRGSFGQSATGPCLNCYLGVQFIPGVTGAQLATLTLNSTAGGASEMLALSGIGRSLSGVLLTPVSQDFGPVTVGSSTASLIFTLTNATATPLSTNTPSLSGDFTSSSAVTGGTACGGTLQSGESCTNPVEFAPSATGTRAGTLNVETGAAKVSAALTGFGIPDPGIHFSPGSLRFANVPSLSATQQTVTLTNSGILTATVGMPSTSDTHFSAASTCSSLAPGSSCGVTVTYAPALSLSSGVLTLPVTTSPGGAAQTTNYTFALSGLYTQENAGIQIIPGESDTVAYGAIGTGGTGSERVLRINNLSGKSLTIAVEAPRQFPLVHNTCGGLAPNGSCNVTVNYQPLTAADQTGTIFVQGLPTDGSATVDGLGYLEGYGLSDNRIVVSGNLSPTGVLDFGQVASGQSSTQLLTITNRGGATTGSIDVTIRRIRTEEPFLSTTNCGSTLPLNGSCTVSVTYAPLYQIQNGTGANSLQNTGVVTIEADAENAPLLVDLAGTASAAQNATPSNNAPLRSFSVSQGALFFSSGAVGTASTAQNLTFANTGTAVLHITGLLTSPDFTVSGGCGTLAVGAACTVGVAFTPQFAGQRSAALEIQSDSSDALEFVSLLGESTPASVSLTPQALSFGSLLVGRSSALAVTLTNTGSGAIAVGGISAAGDFQASGAAAATNPNVCSTGTSLPPNASCVITVTFTPTQATTRRGTLSVTTSATSLPLNVGLIGIGVQPQLAATPNGLTFGNVLTSRSASLSFTLRNSSSTAVNALSFNVSGDYMAASTCGPVTLNAGSSCSLTVTFTPKQTGIRTGVLTITSSDPASPLIVPLTGTGIEGGSFSLTVNGGSTSSTTVPQGIAAGFPLTITPIGGFTGAVAITCTPQGAYQYIACSVPSPSAMLLSGLVNSGISITTVTAVNGTAALMPMRFQNSAVLTCFAVPLFSLPLVSWRRRGRRAWPRLTLVVLLLSMFLAGVSGCGGGVGDPRLRYAATGNYQFTVTATSTTGVAVSQSVAVTVNVTPR